jgi:50S ribosomal subunit-associated GTPase HflX
MVVHNKIDLLGSGRSGANLRQRGSVAISAVTGEAIADLKTAIRTALLSAPDIAILRVPLEEAELVRRAVGLPHQLARRFENESVELAMRIDPRYLVDAGLDGYRIDYWGAVGGEEGA